MPRLARVAPAIFNWMNISKVGKLPASCGILARSLGERRKGWAMTISIERCETSDKKAVGKIEQLIRDAIGERPNEHWIVSIELSGQFCQISIKSPGEIRSERVYDELSKLPEKISQCISTEARGLKALSAGA
jgi:hypothetical protein